MKTCGKCGVAKVLSEFNNSAKGALGKQRYCRDCQKTHYQENKVAYLEQTKQSKRRNTGARYGLTAEENELFRSRNRGLCEICGVKPAKVIDHDHQTGKLRGILCHGCNTGLARMGDSIDGLYRAISYLQG